jgi:hypothetical protein
VCTLTSRGGALPEKPPAESGKQLLGRVWVDDGRTAREIERVAAEAALAVAIRDRKAAEELGVDLRLGIARRQEQLRPEYFQRWRARWRAKASRIEKAYRLSYTPPGTVGVETGARSPVDPRGIFARAALRVVLASEATSGELPSYGERLEMRCSALVLNPEDRERAHWLIEARDRCGYAGAILSRVAKATGCREVLVIRLGCHARSCSPCMARLHRDVGHRVKGPWEQMCTLTIPSQDVGIRDAWLNFHSWIRKFTHALRDALRLRSRHVRVEGGGKLEYAWVVEAHKSGWPHAHLVHNLAWLTNEWADEAWRRASGTNADFVHQREIKKKYEEHHYLEKYLTKAYLPVCVLSLIKGKHIFGSTIPRNEEESKGWLLLQIQQFKSIDPMLKGTCERLIAAGARREKWADGQWAFWTFPESEFRRYGDEWVKSQGEKDSGRLLEQEALYKVKVAREHIEKFRKMTHFQMMVMKWART